ncbi:hypothetical protein [Novosphingobium kaempferiae]|uniref:hypothetical protein n=1 Tax=Novosphingobium kaempferiae TaxID=2896849 RepID=UPI001E5C9B61|nr:hypothetical protein [Novosphingobium kaempferiae]
MPEQSWLEFLWYHKDKAQFVVYALLFIYCLRRAAAPERILSGVLFTMLVVDKLHHFALGGSFLVRHTNIGHLAIDVLVMACTFTIALHANRVYPLWIAGAQIIALFGHLYRFTLEEINRFAYDVMSITPSYIQFVAMSLGVAYHMSRHRKLGSYPSWRRSWPPMPVPQARTSQGG